MSRPSGEAASLRCFCSLHAGRQRSWSSATQLGAVLEASSLRSVFSPAAHYSVVRPSETFQERHKVRARLEGARVGDRHPRSPRMMTFLRGHIPNPNRHPKAKGPTLLRSRRQGHASHPLAWRREVRWLNEAEFCWCLGLQTCVSRVDIPVPNVLCSLRCLACAVQSAMLGRGGLRSPFLWLESAKLKDKYSYLVHT